MAVTCPLLTGSTDRHGEKGRSKRLGEKSRVLGEDARGPAAYGVETKANG